MSVFITRDGRTVESRPHEATFLGEHNEPKSKILLFLMDRKHRGITTGFTAKQLHMETGVNYNYLLTKLSKWAKWGYVERRAVDRGGPCFSYIIGDRGIHFVHRRTPPERRSEYIKQINTFKAVKRGRIATNLLLTL